MTPQKSMKCFAFFHASFDAACPNRGQVSEFLPLLFIVSYISAAWGGGTVQPGAARLGETPIKQTEQGRHQGKEIRTKEDRQVLRVCVVTSTRKGLAIPSCRGSQQALFLPQGPHRSRIRHISHSSQGAVKACPVSDIDGDSSLWGQPRSGPNISRPWN